MIGRPGKPVGTGPLDEPSFDEFYEHAACGYLSLSPDGVVVRVNETFARWTGRTKAELLGDVRFQELLTLGGQLYYETHCAPMLAAGLDLTEVALDVRRADGSVLLTLLGATVHRGVDSQPAFVRLTVFDATHRRGFERHLVAERDAERAARRHAEALGRLADRLAVLETVAQVGSALAGELTGGGFAARAELLPRAAEAPPAGASFTGAAGGHTTGAIPVHGGGDHAFGTLRVQVAEPPDEADRLFFESAAEVAGRAIGRIQRNAAAGRAAGRSGASGLPNERWWSAALKAELRRAAAEELPLTVAVVELGWLEQVTLTQGFGAADAMLLVISDAWRGAGYELLSRFGGEEYAVLLPGLRLGEAKRLISKVRRDAGVGPGFAAGVVQWDGAESALTLMTRAEAALPATRLVADVGGQHGRPRAPRPVADLHELLLADDLAQG